MISSSQDDESFVSYQMFTIQMSFYCFIMLFMTFSTMLKIVVIAAIHVLVRNSEMLNVKEVKY